MILVVAQFCGIMPVVGIKSKSASDLHFKWFAWRTFQFMISSALLTGYVSLSILDIFSGGLTLVRVGKNSKVILTVEKKEDKI